MKNFLYKLNLNFKPLQVEVVSSIIQILQLILPVEVKFTAYVASITQILYSVQNLIDKFSYLHFLFFF